MIYSRCCRHPSACVQPEGSPADALIDIRDAVREYDGEFIDEE
jgi:hypothetical protein